ncbi:MAG: sigma-E factor negative regulatory protein [bacterium]
MEIKKNEHLSAVFDNEASDFENRRLFDEISKDEDMQSTWSRYDLIGECLRQPSTSTASLSSGSEFLASLHKRLEEETEVMKPAANDQAAAASIAATSGSHALASDHTVIHLQDRVWFKPALGLAATATFAAVLFTNAPSLTGGQPSPAAQIAANDQIIQEQEAAALAKAEAEAIAKAEREKQIQLATERRQARLQQYLASHVEYGSRTTIAPTIRTVALGY